MAEELIGNLGYEAPPPDTKCQKLLECVLTGNSKLYLGKVYTEGKIKELNEKEKWKNFLIITKLNSQVRWYSLWGAQSLICILWELVQH